MDNGDPKIYKKKAQLLQSDCVAHLLVEFLQLQNISFEKIAINK